MPSSHPMPVLLLVTTGGTISMVRDTEQGKSIPTLTGAALLARSAFASTLIVRVIDLAWETDMASHLLSLAQCLHKEAGGHADGIVITHGTDTLEEVAYGIDEMVSALVPIVFTGAMRPSWTVDY